MPGEKDIRTQSRLLKYVNRPVLPESYFIYEATAGIYVMRMYSGLKTRFRVLWISKWPQAMKC